ncbi:MAG: hypothetical protein SNJ55_07730 [Chloroherpetonaceae bacterium]
MDGIKKFVAGVERATILGEDYTLAKNYAQLFSFHQFFHSSYRARQGKVLEEMLKNILRTYRLFNHVPNRVRDMHQILESVFNTSIPNLDIDVMGVSDDKILIVQLRSRDDTGGTTAKGSLVDMLRGLIRTGRRPLKSILYLVAIWDARDSQQRQSTISKMFSALKDLIQLPEDKFSHKISEGVHITEHIMLKLVYGTEEMMKAITQFATYEPSALNVVDKVISLIENWDDLWVAYSVASLETANFSGFSNIDLLNEKFESFNLQFNFSCYSDLVKSVDNMTHLLSSTWKENSLPFSITSDRILYIRDLLFLKACYQNQGGINHT